ncbi:MAG: O-antigen ligase family protein [Bacteroidales bacterium]
MFTIIHALLTQSLESVRHSPLLWPSILLFVLTLFLSIISERFYFIFLVFQFIAFPSVINYIFPSVLFGPVDDISNTPYPFLTNIDIYLIFGILIGLHKANKEVLRSWKIDFVLITLLISFLINLLTASDSKMLHLLFVGNYHIRFILLMYLLFNVHDIRKYEKEIILGIVFSILFLFIEAAIYSSINDSQRLESGTLKLNTFGNIIASLGVALFFLMINKKSNHFKAFVLMGMIFSIIIVILTQNRSSFLAICIGIPFIFFIQIKHLLKASLYLLSFVIIFSVLLSILPMRQILSFLPYRVNVFNYTDKIHLKNGKLTIDPSQETNSIISRLQLYTTSVNMFKDHPVVGIGAGRWNYLKSQYGFKPKELLDSHNGILATISQFGLLGIPLLFFIYFYPVIVFRRCNRDSGLRYLLVINIMMMFCDLTNAGIFKYQVAGIMIFIAFLNILLSNEAKSV